MSVTIVSKIEADPYVLKVSDLKEGRAYKSKYGRIYICNVYREFIAFSVCGALIAFADNDDMRFKEINLEIKEI